MKQIIVRSRTLVQSVYLTVPHAFISVNEPEKHPCHLQPTEQTKGILRLSFDDTEFPRGSLIHFNRDHGNLILDFYRKHKDEIDVLVVNCEAGQSRSAGIASFLAQISDIDSTPFMVPPKSPNMLVRKVLRELWLEQTGVLVP